MQMHLIGALCIIPALLLLGAPAHGVGTRSDLDADGMLMVNGQRMLVLGCYERPGTDEGLAELAAAGFNLVYSAPTTEALDQLVAHNLWGWVNLGGNLDLSAAGDQRSQALTATVNALRGHPALLAWEGPDEALWNIYYNDKARERADYRHLREVVAKRKAEAEAGGEDSSALDGAWARFHAAHAEADYEREAPARQELYAQLGEQAPPAPYGMAEVPALAHVAAEGFRQGYYLLKRLDADHPLWFNHAPRNSIAALAEFNRACDICGCDIYPVPPDVPGHSDLRDRSLAAVGSYTERMKLAGQGRPVWMVLQGFGWWDLRPPEEQKAHPEQRETGRRPTYDETRFMAYCALVHGATGIIYYGTSFIEDDCELWTSIKRTVGELAALRPLWEAPALAWRPQAELVENGSSGDHGLWVMPKKYAGDLYLLVVNEEGVPRVFSLRGMEGYEGKSFHRLFEGDTVTVSDGALSGSIRAYGVSIYAGGSAFDARAADLRARQK